MKSDWLMNVRVKQPKFKQYARLMRLDKPIGILLLLWPTLWALWIAAEGVPNAMILSVFIGGVILMRSAGCVINDYADSDIDKHVTRTKHRPLVQGVVTRREALILSMLLALAAFGLVLMLNLYTIALSVVAVVLAASYPFMKRYTFLPQVYLGMAFSWAIPMAFAAQTGTIPVYAWLLFVTSVVWTTAYDTLYAMVDRKDDRRIGVKSTAILFGDADRLIVGALQCIVIGCLLVLGIKLQLSGFYYVSLGIGGGFFLYQHFLIRDRDEAGCFQAFLNNNWFGASVFAGLFSHYLVSA